jgi:hypothetical protein
MWLNMINKPYTVDYFKKILINLFLFSTLLYAQEYIWPTSASRLLTSSFGEYRPRRYHAGYDVKTWGKEGYPVFAMRDGYIWRVRVSPKGYGKVIYVKHRNGYYTVYAHLSRFADPLEQLVRKRQLETASFVQEFYFKPADFPVQQGDTIAFTGSTGIGYPHLHFEIRDPYHRPINPGLFFKNILPDRIAPRPLFLAFVPESFQTSINGQHEIQVFPTVRIRKNVYRISQLIQVTGPFHLSVKVIDFMKGALNRFNIFTMKLKVDGRLIETIRLDTLNYSYNHHSQLYFDYLLDRKGFRRFQTLKKHPAFQLPFYKQDDWKSFLSSLSSGLHESVIEFTDIKGNRSVLHFTFYYQPPSVQLAVRESRDSLYYILQSPGGIESIQMNHYFKQSPVSMKKLDQVKTRKDEEKEVIAIPKRELKGFLGSAIRIKTEDQLTYNFFPIYRMPENYQEGVFLADLVDMPDWLILKLQATEFIPDPAVEDRTAPFVLMERKDINRIDVIVHKNYFLSGDTLFIYGPEEQVLYSFYVPVHKVIPGEKNIVRETHHLFQVEFPSKTLYDTCYIELKTLSAKVLPYNDTYPLVDRIYKVAPFSIRAAIPFYIYLPYDSSYRNNHIFPVYFDQRKGQWFYLPASVSEDSSWYVCPVYSAEYFSLAQDTIPPEIRIVRLPNGKKGKKRIVFLVEDQFSGIDHIQQIEIRLNGEKYFFEWDPEENMVVIPSWALPETVKTIEIRVRDNAGNLQTKKIQL